MAIDISMMDVIILIKALYVIEILHWYNYLNSCWFCDWSITKPV